VPVTGQASAFGAAALGLVLLFLAHFLTPRLLGVHFRLTRAVLGSNTGELAERVRVLTETRRDAVDTSAAELRRIERDLHDGARARLVVVGMDLGTIEALLDKDPAQAKELIAQARKSSVEGFAKLGLEVSDDDNRRVLAVLAYLDHGR
jgi:signal transduction histidine kinase